MLTYTHSPAAVAGGGESHANGRVNYRMRCPVGRLERSLANDHN